MVGDWDGMGRGSGDVVVRQAGCLSRRMKVNRVLPTHEGPLALARNHPVQMIALLLASSS